MSLIAGRACRRPPDRGQRIAVRTVVGRSLLAMMLREQSDYSGSSAAC